MIRSENAPALGRADEVRLSAERPTRTHRLLSAGERWAPTLLLLLAVDFNVYQLYSEASISAPITNDGTLHLLALEHAATALLSGRDPTDPWIGQISMGYPLFHHYQHLAYLPPALIYLLLSKVMPGLQIEQLFRWTIYLLLCLFPLSIYWSMRRFGFERLEASLASLACSLLSTDGLYGFDFRSYIWRGYGLYTQLWGMLLLPPALAQAYVMLKHGKGYLWAVLLVAATILAHLMLGYMLVLSLGLIVILPLLGGFTSLQRAEVRARLRRLLVLMGLVFLVGSYFFIPFLLDSSYLNRSVWELQEKYDAYGHEWTLRRLVSGELLDQGRELSSLTLLAATGLLLSLRRWRQERYRFAAALTLLWLLLYFGRPTWGGLLNLLPMSGDLHFHRFISGFHLGSIFLIGIGLALPWRWARSRLRPWPLLAAAVLTVLLLFPVYRERSLYFGNNTRAMIQSRAQFETEGPEVRGVIEYLRALSPGRVYAGKRANWGREYRVGPAAMYMLLTQAGFDNIGLLFHALSLNSDPQALFDEGRSEQYELFNVRYVVAPAGRTLPDFLRPLASFGRHQLYEAPTSGYFELVESPLTLVGSQHELYAAASHWLATDQPRTRQHPEIRLGPRQADFSETFPLAQAQELISGESIPEQPPRGTVLSETAASGSYQAVVDVQRESVLMLKSTYHSGWQTEVNGRPVDKLMLMPSFIGIRLAPGLHHVRLEYQPSPLRLPLMGLGLITLVLLAVSSFKFQVSSLKFKRG